jgi:recombinational DNA repair ATPase RecF
VLSELDSKRQSFILGSIEHGQVFITCCDDIAVSTYHNGRVIKVDNGELK